MTGDGTGAAPSFILTKPDGAARPEVRAAVAAELAEQRLTVSERFEVVLTADDLAWLWPLHLDESCPLTAHLLCRYLTGQPLTVEVLEGAGGVVRANAVKRRIRRRFGMGPFANCIHTPADAEEAAGHLAYLRAGPEARRRRPRPRYEPRRGRWGRLATLPRGEVHALADDLWEQARRHGWLGLPYAPAGEGPDALVLYDDNVNSLDYSVSSLCETWDDLDPRAALVAVARAGRPGGCVVARGHEDDLRARRDALDALGQVVGIEQGREGAGVA